MKIAERSALLGGKVHLSTLTLSTLALFDLVSTVLLLAYGVQEGNPIFRALADVHIVLFVLGKVVFLAGPILLLEFVRQSKPKSAEQGTWIAVGFYALLYLTHLVRL